MRRTDRWMPAGRADVCLAHGTGLRDAVTYFYETVGKFLVWPAFRQQGAGR